MNHIINFDLSINSDDAFSILCKTLDVKLVEDPEFSIVDGEIVVMKGDEIIDDRGELYLALYHLATKLFMNTDFRGDFDSPNEVMSALYLEKEDYHD